MIVSSQEKHRTYDDELRFIQSEKYHSCFMELAVAAGKPLYLPEQRVPVNTTYMEESYRFHTIEYTADYD